MINIDSYGEIIDLINKLELNTMAERRMAIKPLYDYYQRLLREIAVEYCDFRDDKLKNTHLSPRWSLIKGRLEVVDDPEKWNKLITTLANNRHSVEHSDYFDPKTVEIEYVTNGLSSFTKWLIDNAKEYQKESSNFTFKEAFLQNLCINVENATIILKEKNDNAYENNRLDLNDDYDYLSELVDDVKEIIKKIHSNEDIGRSDLLYLVDLTRTISIFKTIEDTLIELAICPRCGDEIKQTDETLYTNGNSEDSEPYGYVYKVGCDNCGYLLEEFSERL